MFKNQTERELLLLIRDNRGRILYSKLYPDIDSFKGIFDFAGLDDGNYILQVSTLMKSGFIKQSFKQSFQIQSHTKRSISPSGLMPQKDIITLQAN
jgi:hypothetical protein